MIEFSSQYIYQIYKYIYIYIYIHINIYIYINICIYTYTTIYSLPTRPDSDRPDHLLFVSLYFRNLNWRNMIYIYDICIYNICAKGIYFGRNIIQKEYISVYIQIEWEIVYQKFFFCSYNQAKLKGQLNDMQTREVVFFLSQKMRNVLKRKSKYFYLIFWFLFFYFLSLFYSTKFSFQVPGTILK